MVRKLWLVGVAFLCVGQVYGQDAPVPDTLDWKGYYPLEVGNMWEWRTSLLIAYDGLNSKEIIGDTLIGGTSYFVEAAYGEAKDPLNGVDFAGRDTSFIRYDTLNRRVVELTPDGEEYPRTCDLGASFNTTITCDFSDGIMVGGGYSTDFSWSTVGIGAPFQAIKHFVTLGGGDTFYHGVGRLPGLGDGNQGSIGFTYVRIAGVEYGTPVVTLSTDEPEQLGDHALRLYPNPVREILYVEVPRPERLRLTVYDALGRAVIRQDCMGAACAVDASALHAGVYFVQVIDRQGKQEVQTFVVVR